MPVKPGTSRAVISSNIAELIRAWKKTGRIGTSTPNNLEEARRQAEAIAYRKAGRHRRKKK